MKTIPKALKMKIMVRLLWCCGYERKLPLSYFAKSMLGCAPLSPLFQVHQHNLVSQDKVFINCQQQFVSTVLSLLK